jgi:hypothetical protein
MLTFDPRSRIQDGAFNNGLTRMAALVADIERIASGVSPGELARDVPILDHWSVNHRAIPCLVGLSTGHPALSVRFPISEERTDLHHNIRWGVSLQSAPTSPSTVQFRRRFAPERGFPWTKRGRRHHERSRVEKVGIEGDGDDRRRYRARGPRSAAEGQTCRATAYS